MLTETYPLVSIVIITYNDEKNILDSVNSALNQTYKNIEVILIDDGSNDNTPNIIDNLKSKINYIYQENSGIGSARSKGFSFANGKYIQFLDSDDILPDDKIEWQVSFLECNYNFSFVYGNTKCFYSSDKLYESWAHPNNNIIISTNFLFDIIDNGNFINIGQPLFSKKHLLQIGGCDSNIKGSDDQDIMIRLALNGSSGFYIDKTAYYYRHILENRTKKAVARHQLIDRYEGELSAWLKLKNSNLDSILNEKVTQKLSFTYFQLSKAYYKSGNNNLSIKNLYQAFLFKQKVIYIVFYFIIIFIKYNRLKFLLQK